ncbi:SymE family type I addiction module toxin [Caballeronia calidae]|uniref:SymE family type I addiction module toxin n=1 Tax=Caballeronia calidae TaxID=1777139 RepID=UPI001E48D4B4|nr:SymE family type I addiction module toxin [Caballeronia calidae]
MTVHNERHIKIQQSAREQARSFRNRYQPPTLYPWLKLSGRWLEQAGFQAGQSVKVEVQHGRLVITPA